MAKTFYSLNNILEKDATYNIIIGKRSNGKTYAVQLHMIKEYVKTGGQGALIRRYEEDYRGKRGQATFQALVDNGEITKITKGQWTSVQYYAGKWYLSKYDEELDKIVRSDDPFCYAFALTTMGHDKSTSYPRVKNILFDEFISREGYLKEEFIIFMNVLSTIIRQRDNVVIFMLGNTVNKYCPYFKEMNLRDIDTMEQGSIEVYKYVKDKSLKVAVEYCGEGKSKETRHDSDKYFGFDNPKLNMITTGAWEMAIYPHIPFPYKAEECKFFYYIMFDKHTLQCEIMCHEGIWYTFIHKWTTPIREPDKDIVFHTGFDARPNWKRRITKPRDDLEKKIAWFFVNDKVFYADNEVGEIVRNYLIWCASDKGV